MRYQTALHTDYSYIIADSLRKSTKTRRVSPCTSNLLIPFQAIAISFPRNDRYMASNLKGDWKLAPVRGFEPLPRGFGDRRSGH